MRVHSYEYKFENYLQIKDRKHKAALTKLRISAHKLHIETGRYRKYDRDLKNTQIFREKKEDVKLFRMTLKMNTTFYSNVREI